MIEGIVAPVVDLVGAVAAAVVEFCFWIIVSSLRPWRYLFSASYRAKVKLEMVGKNAFYRGIYLFGGTIALLGSIAVVFLIVWLILPRPEPTLQERALEQVEKLWK